MMLLEEMQTLLHKEYRLEDKKHDSRLAGMRKWKPQKPILASSTWDFMKPDRHSGYTKTPEVSST